MHLKLREQQGTVAWRYRRKRQGILKAPRTKRTFKIRTRRPRQDGSLYRNIDCSLQRSLGLRINLLEMECVHMKIKQKLAAMLAALLLLSNGLPVFAAEAKQLPEESAATPGNAMIGDDAMQKMPIATAGDADSLAPGHATAFSGSALQETPIATAGDADSLVPREAPAFSARIKLSTQGYIAEGTFTEFPPDISLVEPLYSLDGKNWQSCERNWYPLLPEHMDNEVTVKKLQNQACLSENQEPLKSYIARQLDRFYLKLRLTRENGIAYESQTAVIERSAPKPLPEDYETAASFPSSMLVRQFRPYICYGRYQITISEASTPEEIAAFLPDTLPIKVDILHENNGIAMATVDCPVTWKPLSLPELIAGQSITIADAAEKIAVPRGTILDTPAGAFQLEQPLYMDKFGLSDEIRLVFNVVEENEEPAGALSQNNAGLDIAFHQKPTGATDIRAYVLAEGETTWTELSGASLLETVNAQPSTPGSGYGLLLGKNQEPYKSFLEAEAAGEKPVPFFLGLKIEGGVYDGRQLILPWPHSYHLPLQLPVLGGSGGNEGNAGADNKDDSTAEGQRPNLPQEPGNSTEEQPAPPQDAEGNTGSQTPDASHNPDKNSGSQTPDGSHNSDKNTGSQTPDASQDMDKNTDAKTPDNSHNTDGNTSTQTPDGSHIMDGNTSAQTPGLSQNHENRIDVPQDMRNSTDGQRPNLQKTPADNRNILEMLRSLSDDIFNNKNPLQADRNHQKETPASSTQRFQAAWAAADKNRSGTDAAADSGNAEETNADGLRAVQDALYPEANAPGSLAFSQQKESTSLPENSLPGREPGHYKLFLAIAAAALSGIYVTAVIFKKMKHK